MSLFVFLEVICRGAGKVTLVAYGFIHIRGHSAQSITEMRKVEFYQRTI